MSFYVIDTQPIGSNNSTQVLNDTLLIDSNNSTQVLNDTFDPDGDLNEQTRAIVASILTILSSVPFLVQSVEFCKKILPYIREPMGKKIFKNATVVSSKRKGFSAEKGFMGDVKREVEYLFDLLTNVKFKDKEIGCNRSLRLCVFVDDLDRCPEHIVVKVLDAVILLLVDGPITCWMAIDSRIVVECIKATKKDVYSNAEIHGHEFLDKIVQLPFCLPDLSDEHKKSYLSKMIESNELDPRRVLFQITSYMEKRASDELGWDTCKKYKDIRKANKINVSNRSDDKTKAVQGLLTHYHAMKEMGHEIHRQDGHIIGMNDRDLVKAIKTSIDRNIVREEHIENFCLVMKSEHRQWREAAKVAKNQPKVATDQSTKEEENQEEENSPSPEKISIDLIQSLISSLPSKSLNVPMFSKSENKALAKYYPFLVGNPRKLKRIMNVFNVCRIIFEHRNKCFNSPPDLTTCKVLRYVILLEQWPCRMSWLLQYIENLEQKKRHKLDTESGLTLDEIANKSAADVYCDFVDGIMHSSGRSSDLMLVDSDPQLFLGLLKEDPELKTKDFLSQENAKTEVLKDYSFNLPFYMKGKVERILDGGIIDREGKFTEKKLVHEINS